MYDTDIARIQDTIASVLRDTAVSAEVDRFEASLHGGKMLRGSLVIEIGRAIGTADDDLYPLAAAVEMLHAASLLHDDVVDGGVERRHAPAFWVSEGTKAAILIGDLMLSTALGLIEAHAPQHLSVLIRALQQMSNSQAEQEFSPLDENDTWEDCVRIAREKTGSLFGFAAACAAGHDKRLAAALETAGSHLGTAYQLADDILDAGNGDPLVGKSLGTDERTGKLTAVRASGRAGIDPATVIDELLEASEHALTAWPQIMIHWKTYVATRIQPVIDRFTAVSA